MTIWVLRQEESLDLGFSGWDQIYCILSRAITLFVRLIFLVFFSISPLNTGQQIVRVSGMIRHWFEEILLGGSHGI
jgi:hypothetical protein